MNRQKDDNGLGREVMEKIQKGEISMRPKVYFSVLTGLSILTVLVMSLLLSYLTSIVILWLRVESAAGPAYGARRNLAAAIAAFPWWALLASGVLLSGIVVFLKRHSNLYRFRWQTLVLLTILAATLIGFFLSNTNVPNAWRHNNIHDQCNLSDNCTPPFNR